MRALTEMWGEWGVFLEGDSPLAMVAAHPASSPDNGSARESPLHSIANRTHHRRLADAAGQPEAAKELALRRQSQRHFLLLRAAARCGSTVSLSRAHFQHSTDVACLRMCQSARCAQSVRRLRSGLSVDSDSVISRERLPEAKTLQVCIP